VSRDALAAAEAPRVPSSAPVRCACVDIGSNTTRLLVADCAGDRLRELMTQRVYTRLGRSMKKSRSIPPEKLEETAAVVDTQVRHALELGAERVAVVATAAIRDARNGTRLARAVASATGLEVTVLSDDEEARLAFVGATRMLAAPVDGSLAVVDVGGGSTEIAIGSIAEGATWTASFRIGSGFLADSYLHSDPPAARELQAVREHVAGTFEGLDTPPVTRAVACGGSASSLRRMAGAELSHDALERAIRLLAGGTAVEIAERFELDPERVRLLPAGVLILEAVSDCLGLPLKISGGGIREGVILELATGAWPGR
jgi:exopolyphosphatase / guanosine-5'-triphosphate,3'-diphosphate pyrophosphatase